jgi:hypothetical protein
MTHYVHKGIKPEAGLGRTDNKKQPEERVNTANLFFTSLLKNPSSGQRRPLEEALKR